MNIKTRKLNKKAQRYQEYNTFINQTDINAIRVVSAKIESLDLGDFLGAAKVNFRVKASYENKENEFNAFHRYNVTIADKEKNEAKAKLSVTFCVTYSSKMPMSDEIFDIFKDRNLPLNTWPYFREFTHNSFARLGWLDIIAPVYRV